jgi:hypothetical protein
VSTTSLPTPELGHIFVQLLDEILWEEDDGVNVVRVLFRGDETAIHQQPWGTHLPPQFNPSAEPEHQATTATIRRTKTKDHFGF